MLVPVHIAVTKVICRDRDYCADNWIEKPVNKKENESKQRNEKAKERR